MKQMIDSHAHLDEERFDEDRDELIKSLKENAISYVINPSSDMDTSRRVVELSNKYDNIFAAVGIHPHDAEGFKEEDLDELRELSKDERVVAIGEIGLDYYYDNSPRDIQKEVFRKQLELSHELDLPVIIHTRDAMGDTYDILKEFEGRVRGVMHCYTGSIEMAEKFMKLGFYISIAGPVTFKNAVNVREMAKQIPLERLLIETDSPYLAPVPNRGKRNDPTNVRYVADMLANLKEIQIDKIIEHSRENTVELFSLKGVVFDD
ncbi:TatD family hydrolase [Mediannikoviicoccus vaginalis]|uniref:TatD family hydrolase n=1 Tax=Mediannikoviicoccus vaginalis TaxID=2899727 RepID=UPI0021080E38|nr:TatD family hydrolase [Mediannikoviicoccus vaginalis]